MKLISLITRLSSLVTIVHGHTRFARQTNDDDNNNPTCSDTSDQCSTWKKMNLCTAEAVKKSCALTCDNCENIAAQIQNSNLSENDAANNNNNSSSVGDDDVCEDIIAGCSNFSSQCDKINIRNGCRKTCNLCKIDTGIGSIVANQLCQDLLPACDLLSARTGCSSPAMKASCALTCGTCENILEPILNKKQNSNNEQSEIASTTAISDVEEQATSVENTSETVKAESEKSDVDANNEETAEITKISDDKDLTTETIETEVEAGSSDNETIEIDESVTPDNNEKSDESSVSITVVTTESSTVDEEKHDEDDGKDHSGHSHNNNKSSGTETICWSVLVVVLTFLVL